MVADAFPFDLAVGQLRERRSAKWRAVDPDVLPLWVAEMDVLPAPCVVEALQAALARGDTGYAHGSEYAEAYAAFAADRWRFGGFEVARSALVADVMLGAVELLKLVTGPGDAVVVTPPVYPPFYAFAEHLGRRVVEVPLTAGGRLDLPALGETFAAVGADGRAAFLLCNPHNPTGTVHTADELAEVAAAADATGVRVVADEIHAPLVLPGATFTPYLAADCAGRGFALVSASKAWNLPALKAAVAFAGPGAAADLARLPEEVSHGPSHFGVLAHTAALRDGGGWLDEVLHGLDRNRTLLGDLLAAHLPAVRWRPPAATYLAWLDFGDLAAVTDSQNEGGSEGRGGARGDASARVGVAAWILEHARVLLSSGPAFGSVGVGCARLNFATSASLLVDAVGRIGDAVARWTARRE
ncbi:MAG: MalY/PatB family protein [Acidimicrobiales bacterium]